MESPSLRLPASLDRSNAVEVHRGVDALMKAGGGPVVLDLEEVGKIDAFGTAVLVEAFENAKKRGVSLRLVHVSPEVRDVLALFRLDRVISTPAGAPAREPLLARIGGWGIGVVDGGIQQAALHLDALRLTFLAPFVGKGGRAAHFYHQLNAVGSGSVAIVGLISLLIGLIMALQAAAQLRQFGADIFVANLVGVSMTRELGPLITAIIIAARSGSSIAAELGTMVVTEEVDALRMMAIDPKRFLVAPRFAAMVVALPCLTLIADLAGITGGFLVGTLGLDLGATHYWNQTLSAVYLSDILTGLVKAFVFANIIAVVACQKGLALRGGPEEVGRATTSAVVFSIIIVIVADFFFTSLFYVLG